MQNIRTDQQRISMSQIDNKTRNHRAIHTSQGGRGQLSGFLDIAQSEQAQKRYGSNVNLMQSQ